MTQTEMSFVWKPDYFMTTGWDRITITAHTHLFSAVVTLGYFKEATMERCFYRGKIKREFK